jgi:hypothetical protein
VLFLYSYNAAQLPVDARELLLPIGAILAFTIDVGLLLGLVLRSLKKAGVVMSAFLLFFFLYGRVLNGIHARWFRPEYLLGVAGLALLVVIVLIVRTRRELNGLTRVLNVAAGAVLLVNLGAGLPVLLRNGYAPAGRASSKATGTVKSATAADAPDIYYIILDGYTRQDVLKSKYGLDNADFIAQLKELGFYIAESSRSNYSQTHLSLASSLNATYLDSLAERLGPDSENRIALIRMVEHGWAADFLRRQGYTLATFESGYTGIGLKDADLGFGPRWALSEFQNVLISTTPLPWLLDRVLHRSQYDLHRERILYTLANLPSLVRARHPVFVFAHIAGAHPPFVLGAHGEKVTPSGYFQLADGGTFRTVDEEQVLKDYAAGYGQQLAFINQRVLADVRQILAGSPRPPVIVIQGDHGAGSVLNWDDPDARELPDRFAILNAVYLPSVGARSPAASGFYPSVSPVNTFRILFSRLFDTSFARLPDRSYFSTISRPFRFYDPDQPTGYGGANPQIAVVAFTFADQPPENPPAFCRQLVTLKYQREKRAIKSFFVRVFPDRAGKLSDSAVVSRAFALYRQHVQAGELPDYGLDYESYCGRGPDRNRVAGLFFPVARTDRMNRD